MQGPVTSESISISSPLSGPISALRTSVQRDTGMSKSSEKPESQGEAGFRLRWR